MSLLPVGITMKAWAQNLRCEYPEDDIPVLSDENAWQEWGNRLRLIGVFSGDPIPRTEEFSDGILWAQRVTQIIGA